MDPAATALCAFLVPELSDAEESLSTTAGIDPDSGRDRACDAACVQMSPRSACARAGRAGRAGRKALESLAEELIKRLDKQGRGALDPQQLGELATGACKRLGVPVPSQEELYTTITAHDREGRNLLHSDALAGFLADLLSFMCPSALEVPEPETPRSTPRQAPLQPPSSPVEALKVTLRTLAGQEYHVALSTAATTDDLKLAIARSPMSLQFGQHLLAAAGFVLRSGIRLDEQGVTPGSSIEVIRITEPPKRVRLQCEGLGCGPTIRGSCGTFRRVPSKLKNCKPIYMRDNALSSWNEAMLYHGPGNRYLVYEEHAVEGGRWALTDEKEWTVYRDRSYAFIAGDAPHPGYLEGQLWRVYRDAKYRGQQEWVEHESLQLIVEDD
mmetsp:Transcript_40802/g.89204  ORF Transcript_40802/g.89204 Transcript_40802/m.89204 type:complete len:384 (+) Transcript_40802:66-1217(+)